MTTASPTMTCAPARSRTLYVPALLPAASTSILVWFAVDTLHKTAGFGRALAVGMAELLAPAVGGLVVVVLVCERLWAAERRPLLARGHLHDALFLALHVLIVVPLMTLLAVAFATLLTEHARWLRLPFTADWPRWPLLLITLFWMDGANWLAHWMDHRFAVLWRFHALHHTQEELSVLTSFRAHPLSHLAGFAFSAVPVVALVGNRGMAPELITAYVCLGTLPHANVRWSFGTLGKVVVSPAYHRLHHSFEGSMGLNLGVVLTVWDVIADRAVFPAKGEGPCKTGLEGRPVPVEQDNVRTRALPSLLAAQLAEPFMRNGGRAPTPTPKQTVARPL